MIARIWRGVVRLDDADEYTGYIRDTGFTEYAETSGSRDAWMLRPVKSAPHCLLTLKTSATPTYWSVNGSPGRGRRPVHRAGWP